MTLNGTLIVQIINFIIAYFLIDRLLLRKSVALIQEERSDQDKLMKDIQIERDQVSEKEMQKKLEWERFGLMFAQGSPKLITRPSVKKFERILEPLEKPSHSKIEQTADELKNLLINKVAHVNT